MEDAARGARPNNCQSIVRQRNSTLFAIATSFHPWECATRRRIRETEEKEGKKRKTKESNGDRCNRCSFYISPQESAARKTGDDRMIHACCSRQRAPNGLLHIFNDSAWKALVRAYMYDFLIRSHRSIAPCPR